MTGHRPTDQELGAALRAHLPAGAHPDLRARIQRATETTPQQRRLPLVLGQLTDADPAARRRASLMWAAALLATVLVGAAAAGALRTSKSTEVLPSGFGTLAFVRQGDLYLSNHDGTGAVRAAHVDGVALSSPLWSPDGRWVAVQTAEPAILALDTSTMSLRRLVAGSITALASDFGPWEVGGWSPDGRELAFLTPRGGIAFVRVADGVVRPLPGWPERPDPFPGPVAWSPDGRWLVTRTPTEPGEPLALVRVDVVTGVVQPIVAPSDSYDYWLTWAPDSSRVAFSRNNRRLDGVWVAAADGSGARRILPADSGAMRPLWSPDGAWLAIRSLDRSVRSDALHVVRPDGSDLRSVAGGLERIVGWSRDGAAIGYTVGTGETGTTLHVVSLADLTDRVLPVPGDASDHAWAPVAVEPTAGSGAVPSAIAAAPSDGGSVEPAQDDPLRPDAAWAGLAYRVQDGQSVCTIAVLRFPDQRTMLAPPEPSGPGGEPGSSPSAGATVGPLQIASCEPRFSPDGSAVMWALQPSSTFEIAHLDGSRRAGPMPQSEPPSWSPRGSWLAVPCQLEGCGARAYLVRPDGSGRRDLPGRPSWSADDRLMAVEEADGTLLVGNGDGTALRAIGAFPLPRGWSPDGSTFLFVRDGNAWLAEADGSGSRNLSRFALGGVTDAWWSPDGRWIAVLQGTALWIESPDGSVQRRIGTGPEPGDPTWGTPWAPAWSPDGRTLAVEHGGSVTILDVAGGRSITLRDASQPAWSHDGRLLAVVADRVDGRYIDVVRADGTGRTTVATGVASPPLTWVR
jgi:Tol biopolymer transport system component